MRYLGQNFHNLVLYLDYRACLLPFVGGGVGHGCVCVFVHSVLRRDFIYIFYFFFYFFYFLSIIFTVVCYISIHSYDLL